VVMVLVMEVRESAGKRGGSVCAAMIIILTTVSYSYVRESICLIFTFDF